MKKIYICLIFLLIILHSDIIECQTITTYFTGNNFNTFDLQNVKSIKYSNGNLIYNLNTCQKHYFNLLTLKKIKFEGANSIKENYNTIEGSEIYPTITSDFVIIELKENIQYPVYIISSLGEIVGKLKVIEGVNHVDLSRMKSGIYFISLNNKTFKLCKI